MDALWETVDKDPPAYLPRLREELRRQSQNRFFLYDGSQLLIKHSHVPEDLELAAESIGRTDLEDVRPEEFFRAIHRLAVWGANVWPCVNNLLSEPRYKVFIPQHHLMLDQMGVVIYCLLPMKEELYVSALKSRLNGEENRVVVKSILAGLSMAVTEEAQAALSEYACSAPTKEFRSLAEPLTRLPTKGDVSLGKEVNRELLFTFLGDFVARRYDNPAYDFEEIRKGAPGLIRKEDLSKLRALRRKHAERVSDEAMGELQYLTLLMGVSLGSER